MLVQSKRRGSTQKKNGKQKKAAFHHTTSFVHSNAEKKWTAAVSVPQLNEDTPKQQHRTKCWRMRAWTDISVRHVWRKWQFHFFSWFVTSVCVCGHKKRPSKIRRWLAFVAMPVCTVMTSDILTFGSLDSFRLSGIVWWIYWCKWIECQYAVGMTMKKKLILQANSMHGVAVDAMKKQTNDVHNWTRCNEKEQSSPSTTISRMREEGHWTSFEPQRNDQ